MSDRIRYPVPWDRVFGLTPHIARGTRENIDDFTASIVARMKPEPLIEGLDRLPDNARFVLAANHYERDGLWILHSAAVLTQAVRRRYGPGNPPVRWLVTANWPPLQVGPWKFPSPGDWLLPKVAHALHCYPISFAGMNPRFTARSLRQVLRDVESASRPLGLFPEGAAGSAGVLAEPLPGIDRLLTQLARRGLPVVPAGISEAGRFVIRFGAAITTEAVLQAKDAARLVMARIGGLIG